MPAPPMNGYGTDIEVFWPSDKCRSRAASDTYFFLILLLQKFIMKLLSGKDEIDSERILSFMSYDL